MSISKEVEGFKRSKNPLRLLKAAILVWRQGRLIEFAYGAWCFIGHRPSQVIKRDGFAVESYFPELERQFQELRKHKAAAVLAIGGELYCTDHGLADTEDGFIFGEYGEFSARIFLKDQAGIASHDFYNQIKGLRHIHALLRVGETVYITTGDTHKYLDEWTLARREFKFKKRLMKRLGGFTTCARVGGKTYFGTDFSQRPNYLFCLETKQKSFFPRPAYTQYCYLMFVVEERYLVCFNRHLSKFSGALSVSVFDTQTGCFLSSQSYTGNVFVTDHVAVPGT